MANTIARFIDGEMGINEADQRAKYVMVWH